MPLKSKSAVQLRREQCLRELARIANFPTNNEASDMQRVIDALLVMIGETQITIAACRASLRAGTNHKVVVNTKA